MRRPEIAILVLVLASLLAVPADAGWVDTWFDQKVEGKSEKIKGKDRTYWSGGQFSARVYDKDGPINLFTYEKPRFNVGCGGVDISMGSMSFVSKEYMVKKFQRMIHNAPIIFFDLVLQEYAQGLSNSLKAIENALNQYSQLQLGECSSLKDKVVTFYKSNRDWSKTEGQADQEAGVEQGQSDSWQTQKDRSTANDNQPTSTTAEKTADCPAELKVMFFEPETSLLENVIKSGKSPLGDKEELVDMLRGFIGDVWIMNEGGTNIPVGVKRCAENKPDAIDSLMHGKAKKRPKGPPESAACVDAKTGDKANIYEWAEKSIRGAVKSMRERNALGDADRKFINEIPLATYKMLETIVRIGNRTGPEGAAEGTGDESAAIRELATIVTRAYAKRIMDDLVDVMAVGRAAAVTLVGQQGHSAKPGCQPKTLEPYIESLDSLFKEAEHVNAATDRAYAAALNEKRVLDGMMDRQERFEKVVKSKVGETVLRKLVSQGLK